MRRGNAPGTRAHTRRRATSGIVAVAAVTATAVLLAAVFGAGAAALARRTRAHDADRAPIRVVAGEHVVLWGDSLAYEAALPFVARLRAATGNSVVVDPRTYGGTATCDWLPDIEREVASARIAVALLEFSGNALTPCMAGTDGRPLRGAAYLAAYRRATLDAIRVLRAAGARVYLVGAPRGRTPSPEGEALQRWYRRVAGERRGVVFLDAGAAVLDRGRWTSTLPCLADENAADGCVSGRIVVRAPDGAHFCPGAGPAVRGVTGPCPRWSSGAVRYGRAMADAVAEVLVPRST
jgi:hypothetical protein